MSGFNSLQAAAYDAAARQRYRAQFAGMSAYDRHKKMVHDLAAYYGRRLGGDEEGEGAAADAPVKTDYEILREAYRFIRTEADDVADSWEVRLARRYYAKLYREFAIADLSRHQQGRVGLRWRSQKEVVSGKGQFICGAVGCEERRGLASFEVPFAYEEAGQRKQALVKVRVCPTHAYQLDYKKHKEAEEAHKRREQKEAKRAKRRKHRRRSGGGSRSGGESSSSSSSSSEDDVEGGVRGKRRRSSSGGDRKDGAAAGERGSAPAAAAAAGWPPGAHAAAAAAAAGQQQQQSAGEGEFEEFFKGLFE